MSPGRFKKKCLSLNLLGYNFGFFYRKNKKTNIENNGQADEAKKSSLLFFNDIPIEKRECDLLNRGAFVENIVNFLTHTKSKDSFVVAINGKWGEGKTSVKNLIRRYIENDESKNKDEDKQIIIEISPWKWIDPKDVQTMFMKEIYFHLASSGNSKSKKLVKKMETYIGYLNRSDNASSPYDHSLTLVLIFVGFLSIGVIFLSSIISRSFEKITFPTMPPFAAIWVYLILFIFLILIFCYRKWIFEKIILLAMLPLDFLFEIVSKKHSAEIYKELLNARRDFSKELKYFNKPIILAVDEIDRLNEHQTQHLFNALKANIDFPNFIYLLFYQKDIVKNKIHLNREDNNSDNEDRDYLEKIVQVSIDLPKVSEERLLEILNNGIREIFEKVGFWRKFKEMDRRWRSLFGFDNPHNKEKILGINSYFKNIRRVHRFLSSLSFYIYSFIDDDGVIDVNLVDLISIETIRIFDPNVYSHIKSNPVIFTAQESEMDLMIDLNKNEIKNKLQKIIKSSYSENNVLDRIIIQLFPNMKWCVGSVVLDDVDFFSDGYLDMRINNKECFERYFTIALSSEDVPQSEVRKFISLYNDKTKMTEYLRFLKRNNTLNLYLSKFSSYTRRDPSNEFEAIIATIFDVGDELSEIGNDKLYSEIEYATNIVTYALRNITDMEERKRIMKNTLEKTEKLIIPLIWIYIEFEKMKSTRNDKRPDHVLNDAEIKNFKKIGLKIIKKYKASGELENSNYLATVLIIWDILDETAAKEWVRKLIKSDAGLIRFFKAFRGHFGVPAKIGLYSKGISKSIINKFFQIEIIKKRLEDIFASDNIEENERETVQMALIECQLTADR